MYNYANEYACLRAGVIYNYANEYACLFERVAFNPFPDKQHICLASCQIKFAILIEVCHFP
jgi:hypothetical protein